MLIRLFSFRPSRSGDSADDFVRHELLPALVQYPRVRWVYAARATAEHRDRRVVASIWDESGAPSDGAVPDLASPLPAEVSVDVIEPAVELHHADITLGFDDGGPAQILRIFRGRVKAGELDNYVDQARSGTLADAIADHGPEGLFLARTPPDGFVTVSAWSGWDRIAASTGGNLRQPIATRHGHMLDGGTAEFFEILPHAMSGRLSSASTSALADMPDRPNAFTETPAVAPGT